MEEKLWYKAYAPGVNKAAPLEQVTISQALSRAAEKFPHVTALNYMGKRITYQELDGLVNAFARGLLNLGVKPNDKVSVCLPNIPQTVISNMAIFRIGAVAVQNNPLYTERELEYQLNDSDSKLVLTLTVLVPRMEKIKPKTKIEKIIACSVHAYLPFPKKQLFPFVKKAMCRKITPSEDVLLFEDLIAGHSTEPLEDRSQWEAPAAIIYTGGVTGVSKGAVLSNQNLSSNVQQFVAWFPDWKPGEESLVGNYPIFHSAGFNLIQNFTVWQAFEHIMVPRPDAQINIEILKKYKPTLLPGVPTIFVGLLAEPEFRKMDLSFIKGFFSGAAPLSMNTIAEIKNLTGSSICEVYGLTEASPMVAATPWGGQVKAGTVGVPIPHTEVKLFDLESGKKEVAIGEIGEIAIHGPQIMLGYYNRPEETRKALRDGWFYTGDIGTFDEDGYLTIVDRTKDMIIASGFNVYPTELDEIIAAHPKILEACTIGIPDDYRGETVKAFIVVKKDETLSKEEVIQYCKEKLAAYKVPKIIEFIEELPKNVVGKVLRRQLRERELERAQAQAKEYEDRQEERRASKR